MEPSICFENVSKSYRLGETGTNLREALSTLGEKLFSKNIDRSNNIFWALKNVSYEIQKGEAFGIIGPNGAGKTTSLKLLSRISSPTIGRITVNGRVSALIELGAGFHPDLTGRENIYLNASILGLTLAQVNRKFDQIVAFSGLEEFIDTPVKRYSSGMYVRLGFSVAAHFEPDILLVDEVLAVGDNQFRQRCIQRIKELRQNGTTIVFVSHNFYLVESVCDSCIFLLNGEIQSQGKAIETINAYETWINDSQIKELNSKNANSNDPTINSSVDITDVEIRRSDDSRSRTF